MNSRWLGGALLAVSLACPLGAAAAERMMSGAVVSPQAAAEQGAEVQRQIRSARLDGSLAASNWQLNYDWFCQGTPRVELVYVYPDSTYLTSEGPGGTWTKDGKAVVFSYSEVPTVYSGTLSANNQRARGTMTFNNGQLTGCWTAERL